MSKSEKFSWLEFRRGYALQYDADARQLSVLGVKRVPKRDWGKSGKYSCTEGWLCEISEDLKHFSQIENGNRKAQTALNTLVTTVMDVLMAAQHRRDDAMVRLRKSHHKGRCIQGQRATIGVSIAAFVTTLIACSVVQAVVVDISSTHLWVAGSAVMVGIIAAAILTWFHLANRKNKTPKPAPFRLFNKQKPATVQRVVTNFAKKHLANIGYEQKSLGASASSKLNK